MYPYFHRLCLAVFLIASLPAKAQMPVLKIAGNASGSVSLQQLDIDVRVAGTIATTTWEMTFINTTGRTLEGELNFPLPEGADITGYALDINGHMRDAVPVEKAKGARTFEAIEHRRVDPGLLEKTEGNNFRTRIYPINAHSTRTLRIRYEEELRPQAGQTVYTLPLAFTEKIVTLNLALSVLQSGEKPLLLQSPGDDMHFSEWQHNYTAQKQYHNILADKPIRIQVPMQQNGNQVMMQPEGGGYAFLLNTSISQPALKKLSPGHITLLWDASLSGLQRNHQKEAALLNSYLSRIGNVNLTLIVFSNTIRFIKNYRIVNGHTAALLADLDQVIYDGSTQLAAANISQLPGDEFLLFSDGQNTWSGTPDFSGNRPVYCISSSPTADFSRLKNISAQTGGSCINLLQVTDEAAIKALCYQPFRFLGIRKNAALTEVYPSQPMAVDGSFSIAGHSAAAKSTIVLQFGYGKRVTAEKTVQVDAAQHTVLNADLPRLRARKQIAELDIDYARNKKLIEQLGKKYGIVTRNTSLIVLENVTDYVQYGIEPPAELQTQYEAIVKQRSGVAEQAKKDALDDAKSSFSVLKNWWEKDFTRREKPKKQTPQPAPETPAQNNAPNPGRTAPPVVHEPTTSGSEIFGTILDEKKLPMTGCTVQVEQNGRVLGGSVCDIDGNYSIKPLPPGTYELRIFTAGYKTVLLRNIRVVANRAVRVNNKMEISPDAQGQVVVNALPQHRSVTGRSNIQNLPTQNINDVAVVQPAVIQQKSNGALNIGGARTEGTLYIIDGVQVSGNRYASQSIEDVQTMLSGISGEYGDANGGIVAVKNAKADYLKLLKRAGNDQRYDTYLQLRKTHVSDPVFYFAAAGCFIEKGQRELGLRILSNMAELSFQDHEVYKMLGYKLREAGQKEDAIYVFRKVMEWRPDEPQSYRDYALALAGAGYAQRALDTLYYALNRKYDSDIMNKYGGISEIIITEINQLITAARKPLNTSAIPAFMIQPMPVDARVVINWNMDDTDIDLWVTDPAGEKCYYDHQQTNAGGRISKDFTQGYGPEQFMIRKATKGKYKIQVNYYGDRQLRLAGPTTIFAEIYTHYGTPRQQRRLITLQLQDSNEKETAYIGSFSF